MSPEKEFNPQTFRSLMGSDSLEIPLSYKEAGLTVSLLEKCRPYMDEEELEEVILAEKLMFFALAGEKRKSGDPSSTHSLEVAHILADAFISEGARKIDKEIIIAGLLHDLPEDTKDYPDEKKDRIITVDHIRSIFGDAVASMVDAATKLKGKKNIDLTYRTHLKIFESLFSDPRVIFLKLADRLHNMRTIRHLEKRDQIRKARETFKVYVPLAFKLGLVDWADELADLSLEVLYGERKYQRLKRICEELFSEKKLILTEGALTKILGDVTSAVYLKKPSLYSLYQEFGESFLDISDKQIAAKLTVVVSEPEVPEALVAELPFLRQKYWKAQVFHAFAKINFNISQFPPGSAERLEEALERDEVAEFPLTIVDLPVELRFIDKETQVRQKASLLGYYKRTPGDPLYDYASEKLEKLRENLRRIQQTGGVETVAREFTENLDVELITVYSEDGREYVFPRGKATVLDAAYAFRTSLGRIAVSATIIRNGQILEDVPLNVFLVEGDRVIIKSDPQSEDIRDARRLDFLFTPYAERKERTKLRKMVDEEKCLTSEKPVATALVIDRGESIIKDLFASVARERGVRHIGLIARIDRVRPVFADHHLKMRLPGKPEEDLLTDFLTHVGLNEIRMEGKGREMLMETVNALVEYQFSLIPIHLITKDVPGVVGIIGGLMAGSEINIESIDGVAYQKATGYQWITILIAPEKLAIFREKTKGALEAATIEGEKMIKEVIIHEPAAKFCSSKS